MGFYDEPANVDQYISMCEGYDGNNLYEHLQQFLPHGSSVLELGSGPGLDLTNLSGIYKMTASDLSDEFLKRIRQNHPDIPALKVDAANLQLSETFDCIYSNKVLHHLTEEQLEASLQTQKLALNSGGLIAHSYWLGDENEEMAGMRFTKYREQELLALVNRYFDVVSTLKYGEFENDDSLFVIAKTSD